MVWFLAQSSGYGWSDGQLVVSQTTIEQDIRLRVPNRISLTEISENFSMNSSETIQKISTEKTTKFTAISMTKTNVVTTSKPRTFEKLLVVGLLSADFNYGLRMAQRETWLKGVPYAEHRFLLDNATPELLEEQKLHNDIVFLNATFTGARKGLGEKLFNWFRYAVAAFPHIPLIAKGDDDVFVCEGRMLEVLKRVNHPRCYAGWSHAAKEWKKDGGLD